MDSPTARRKSGTMRLSVLAPRMAGIKYARLEKDGLQWPCPTADHPGTRYCTETESLPAAWGCLRRWTGYRRRKFPIRNIRWCSPPAGVCIIIIPGHRPARCEGINDLLGEETADISVGRCRKPRALSTDEKILVKSRRGEGDRQGPGNPSGSARNGLDGVSFPRELRQLADQSRLRSGYAYGGIQGLRRPDRKAYRGIERLRNLEKNAFGD